MLNKTPTTDGAAAIFCEDHKATICCVYSTASILQHSLALFFDANVVIHTFSKVVHSHGCLALQLTDVIICYPNSAAHLEEEKQQMYSATIQNVNWAPIYLSSTEIDMRK